MVFLVDGDGADTNGVPEMAIKTLTYDTPVRIAAWADSESADVFTVRGYAQKNGQDPDAAEARAIANGHELASTIYSSGALVGDRNLGARLAAERRAKAASATVLEDGEPVMIEGKRYKVRVNRGNAGTYPANSDPIAFLPEA